MKAYDLTSLMITSIIEGALLPPIVLITFTIASKWKPALWIIVGYAFIMLLLAQMFVEKGNVSFIKYIIFMSLSGAIIGTSSLVVMFLTCKVGGRFVEFISTNPACTFHRGVSTCLIVTAGYIFFAVSTYTLLD